MEKFKFIQKDNISKLPKSTGVYAFKKGAKLLYIGKAANLRVRVKNHFSQPKSIWEQTLLRQGYGGQVGFIQTDSEIEALIQEAKLIKKYRPKYNIVWRDDKNYFYAAITKEKFPTVFITHQPRPHSKIDYVGPFVEGRALKQALNILRRVFPYRTCKPYSGKPCLWYQLDRCPGPCLLGSKLANEIPKLEDTIIRESQRNVRNLKKILEGNKYRVIKTFKKEMRSASKIRNFEKAAKIRDQIQAMDRVLAHARLLEIVEPAKEVWNLTERDLKRILNVKKRVFRIEAYDISDIQGKNAVGSMVTFIGGKANKNFYRKFKMKVEGKPNDVAMIQETLSRRFNHPEWGWPDLILIDGGIAQLNAALKIKRQTTHRRTKVIKVISLAKKENKLFIEGRKEPLLLKTLPREIFNLTLQLRDEAHRFAISYHRKLREKF
jgi:excinuclease ABC subunit C